MGEEVEDGGDKLVLLCVAALAHSGGCVAVAVAVAVAGRPHTTLSGLATRPRKWRAVESWS